MPLPAGALTCSATDAAIAAARAAPLTLLWFVCADATIGFTSTPITCLNPGGERGHTLRTDAVQPYDWPAPLSWPAQLTCASVALVGTAAMSPTAAAFGSSSQTVTLPGGNMTIIPGCYADPPVTSYGTKPAQQPQITHELSNWLRARILTGDKWVGLGCTWAGQAGWPAGRWARMRSHHVQCRTLPRPAHTAHGAPYSMTMKMLLKGLAYEKMDELVRTVLIRDLMKGKCPGFLINKMRSECAAGGAGQGACPRNCMLGHARLPLLALSFTHAATAPAARPSAADALAIGKAQGVLAPYLQ